MSNETKQDTTETETEIETETRGQNQPTRNNCALGIQERRNNFW